MPTHRTNVVDSSSGFSVSRSTTKLAIERSPLKASLIQCKFVSKKNVLLLAFAAFLVFLVFAIALLATAFAPVVASASASASRAPLASVALPAGLVPVTLPASAALPAVLVPVTLPASAALTRPRA